MNPPNRSMTLRNIGKSYVSGIPVLRSLEMEVKDGEFMVVVGESGCGKTTLLRIIAGLDRPDLGQVFLGDQDVTERKPREREVGMVFQDLRLYPHMTVWQNLAFGLESDRVDRASITQRVEYVTKLLHLDTTSTRYPHELSGGEQQRVALGRALIRNPRVLLLDEPLSQLDAPLRAELRTELRRIHTELGLTIIYVTHDQIEALSLGDRVAVIHQGKFLQVDTPQAIYQRPACRYVAEFIGEPAMCFFDGEIAMTPSGFQLEFLGHLIALPLGMPCDAFDDFTGKLSIHVGIRPESFELEPINIESSITIESEIVSARMRGADTLIECLANGIVFRVLVRTIDWLKQPSLKQRTWYVRTKSLHGFRRDNGHRF